MQKDVTLEPNTNEVKRCWYVSESELKELLQKAAKDSNILMTPWFKMINDHFLYKWWASLSDLSQFENDSEIHKMPGIPAPILQLWTGFKNKESLFWFIILSGGIFGSSAVCPTITDVLLEWQSSWGKREEKLQQHLIFCSHFTHACVQIPQAQACCPWPISNSEDCFASYIREWFYQVFIVQQLTFNNYLYFIQKEMGKYCCTFVHPVSFDKHRETQRGWDLATWT